MGIETMGEAMLADFAARARDAILTGALNWCRAHGVDARQHSARLADEISTRGRAAILAAMEDAREALAVGMGDAASATFEASLLVCGIAAAKAAVGEAVGA